MSEAEAGAVAKVSVWTTQVIWTTIVFTRAVIYGQSGSETVRVIE